MCIYNCFCLLNLKNMKKSQFVWFRYIHIALKNRVGWNNEAYICLKGIFLWIVVSTHLLSNQSILCIYPSVSVHWLWPSCFELVSLEEKRSLHFEQKRFTKNIKLVVSGLLKRGSIQHQENGQQEDKWCTCISFLCVNLK